MSVCSEDTLYKNSITPSLSDHGDREEDDDLMVADFEEQELTVKGEKHLNVATVPNITYCR